MKNLSISLKTYSINIIKSIRDTFRLIRPHHWIKNLFLFVPLFFAGEILNIVKIIQTFYGFIAFSLVASSVYILNDLKDADADRLHPVKRFRPIASGELSKRTGLIIFSLLIVAGFFLAYSLELKFLFILSIYFLLNVGYTYGLKNISILDVILVSIGFVLRVRAGGTLAYVHVSQWLTIMVFLLALFMALGKRRDDILIKLESGKDMRKAVKGYNLEFLTATMTLIIAISLVAYLMYCVSPNTMAQFGTHRLYHTFLFVLAGVLRYFQLIYINRDSGSPTKILYKDTFIHICILLWLASFAFIIYFPDFEIFD